MPSVESLIRELNDLDRQKYVLIVAINEIRRNKIIPCAKCGARHKIKDIVLLDISSYTEPHGCTGGDYWSHSEYNFNCRKCSVRNRFLFNDQYQVKWEDRGKFCAEKYFFRIYLPLFAKNIQENEPRSNVLRAYRPTSLFVNNYHVDQKIKSYLDRNTYKELCSHYTEKSIFR